ncbi:CAP domain-containing protein [Meiothermus sp. PNK-Is4]|nr:CAP domain-containing protein [Meiothermus sp. Pnk-1]RYM40873.1 CAP domain-containing protein [Meiothermus sp. PNK-Is4]
MLFSLALAQSAPSALELEVLARTNQERVAQGLRPLEWDNSAAQVARAHGLDMLRRGYFAHLNPEGESAADRLRKAGLAEVEVGENLALYENYPDAKIPAEAVRGWMNSPHHRDNLLKPSYTHLGVGLVRQGNRVVVVQNFLARPFSLRFTRQASWVEENSLSLRGEALASVGVFIEGNLYAELGRRFDTTLELPPGTNPRFGWRSGSRWLEVAPGQPGFDFEVRQEKAQVFGYRLQLVLPAGQYALAVGKEPRFWRSVDGPATLELPLPAGLGSLWVGRRQGDWIDYAFRIPLDLEPSAATPRAYVTAP